MNRKEIWLLILVSTIHFATCILAGAMGWDWQSVIVTVMSAFAIYIAYHKIARKLSIAFLVIIPFFLLYVPLSIRSNNSLNYPVWICGISVSVITFFLVRFKMRQPVFLSIIAATALLEYFIIYPNYFSHQTKDANPGRFMIHNSKIVDVNNREIFPEEFKGKVVLFDVWHSACYWCIKQFPEVQELYDQYKSDSLVSIILLNYPIDRDSGIKQTRFTDKYTFEKLYFVKEEDYIKYSGDGVPRTLIMDKNFHCRYAGQLNTGWNIFIGNAKRIINKLKNE